MQRSLCTTFVLLADKSYGTYMSEYASRSATAQQAIELNQAIQDAMKSPQNRYFTDSNRRYTYGNSIPAAMREQLEPWPQCTIESFHVSVKQRDGAGATKYHLATVAFEAMDMPTPTRHPMRYTNTSVTYAVFDTGNDAWIERIKNTQRSPLLHGEWLREEQKFWHPGMKIDDDIVARHYNAMRRFPSEFDEEGWTRFSRPDGPLGFEEFSSLLGTVALLTPGGA